MSYSICERYKASFTRTKPNNNTTQQPRPNAQRASEQTPRYERHDARRRRRCSIRQQVVEQRRHARRRIRVHRLRRRDVPRAVVRRLGERLNELLAADVRERVVHDLLESI